MESGKEIELRCEEVQEILTHPPHALVRWGISIFFGILLMLFVGGCYFQYPDVVTASITITTEHPPVWIRARSSGKVQEVYTKDRDSIHAGEVIAVLENSAETMDVNYVIKQLSNFVQTDSCILACHFAERPALGSVQNAYAAFLKSLTDYKNFLSLNLYKQKLDATRKELEEYRNYIGYLKRQEALDNEQSRIAAIIHRREQRLLEEGLIAQSVYDEAQLTYLGKQQGSEQLKTSLSSARIREAQLEQSIIETEIERNREMNLLKTTIGSAVNELWVSIEEWKMNYLLISPANGLLSYNNIWQENQLVNSGDKVFSVVTSEPGKVIGKIKLPVSGSGKVVTGQRVNIQISGYPYMEYGFLSGEVISTSLLPDEESMYAVTISLPQDLTTSYGKKLTFNGELNGIAEIMTNERSITSRLISPLRYLFEKYR